MAVKWLQRANDTINAHDPDHLTRDEVELRLAILQSLVHANLALDSIEGYEKAENLVGHIGDEIGDKLFVLILELELLSKSPAETFDCEAYANILRQMIRAFNHSESSFKLIIHHLMKLHSESPVLGCEVLDDFLLCLQSSERQQWVEEVIIKRLWFMTQQQESVATIESVQSVLTEHGVTLSPEATGAAHTVRQNPF